MQETTKAKMLFDQWRASLAKRNRKMVAVETNFLDLWSKMFKAKISMEVAHSFLKDAQIAHHPDLIAAKRTFNARSDLKGTSFDDFYNGWKSSIDNIAINAFFEFYSPESEEPAKKYGAMDEEEYRVQRKYVERFAQVDVEAAKKELEKMLQDDEEDDLWDKDFAEVKPNGVSN